MCVEGGGDLAVGVGHAVTSNWYGHVMHDAADNIQVSMLSYCCSWVGAREYGPQSFPRVLNIHV